MKGMVFCILLLCLAIEGGSAEYFTVLEEQNAGTFVGNITRRTNSQYHFSESSEFFRIDPNLASIHTKIKIDREVLLKDEFQLVVLSTAPIYATEVTIKIVDINDHAPTFKNPTVNLSISESVTINTLIPIESANDPDIGTNTISNYSIAKSNYSDQFSLELILNLLHLKIRGTLDRETKDSYTLNISAFDGGNPVRLGHMILHITVLDTNDNAPLFDPSAFKSDVFENAPIGTVIHEARATDADIGRNGFITYSIELSNQGFANVFHINSTSGQITLNGKLDYEKTKKYILHVIAKDSGIPVLDGRATVTVNIKDINDNPPKISNGNGNTVNLTENRIHQFFAFFTLTDPDSSSITLIITSGNEDDKFDLNKYNLPNQFFYFLSLKSKLDRESKSKYTLKFRASDNGFPPLTTNYTLVVNVVDVNDHHPVFKQGNHSPSIAEGCPVGTYVGTVTATDSDVGLNSKITYSISDGNLLNWFKISSYSGLITTNSAIDYDVMSKPFILLEIAANDSGTPHLHSSIAYNITILDKNDNTPTFPQPAYAVSVNESTPVNSLLLKLRAKDADHAENGQIRYIFSQQSAKVLKHFQINNAGDLILLNALNYHTDQLFDLYVTAEDGGVPSRYSRVKVTINVLDVDNFAPVFHPSEYYFNLLAANSNGFIGKISAIDLDSGIFGESTYSIESGDCCRGFFIDSRNGNLNSTAKIPAGVSHKLVIKASNHKGTYAAFATVYIFTLNTLMQNPAFLRDDYTFNIMENSVGRFVGKVQLIPHKFKEALIYSITSGDDWNFFNITGDGMIITRKLIDRERFGRLSIVVTARTNTTIPLICKTRVSIHVDDVNDNSPELANQMLAYNYSVREDAPIGSYVLTVRASDADLGSNSVLKYTIKQGSADDIFHVDPSSGKVYLVKSILNKNVEVYMLNLEISDLGTPAQVFHTKIPVFVLDNNDNHPKFSATSYSAKIMSNLTVNTMFLQVKAFDKDLGRNGRVLYRISNGNTADMFGIFPSGWLYLKQLSLDRNINYYSLSIEAYDGGTPAKVSKIQVSLFVDANHRQKIFKTSSYATTFAENLPANSTVASISKSIIKLGSGLVTFSLVHPSLYFTIGASDGVLKSKVVLDREKIIKQSGSDQLMFLITAEAKTNERFINESCIVSVKIADLNDNRPEFKYSVYISSVLENSVSGTSILKISASDPDSTTNHATRYELEDTSSTPFVLDATTGVLSIAQSPTAKLLNYESVMKYNLTALAIDVKNASLYSKCNIIVYVRDANDNKPLFTPQKTSINVTEATKVGSTLLRFTAIDADEGLNAFVKYSIVENSGSFDINSYSGDLYLVKQLDFETTVSYHMTIIAKDSGATPLQTSMPFTVYVSDSNDNPPVFHTEPSVIHITENIALQTAIGDCSASDADSGRNKLIRYSIVEQKPTANAFKVDPATCAISNLIKIDREENDLYYLVIKAEDQAVTGRLSSVKNVTINVLDINDNTPIFVPPLGNGFVRRPTTGWQVIKLLASDPDLGVNGTVKYSILPGLDAACFAIEADSGVVTVIAPLATSKKIFTMNVKASDGSAELKSATVLITLFVLGSFADAPMCLSASRVTVNEGKVIGSRVFQSQASTSEISSNIRYFIRGGNTRNSFAIDSSTGWVTNRALIDYENGPKTYSLIVSVVELASTIPRTVDCPVNIQIADINDNDPKFPSSSTEISVMENVPVNSKIYTLTSIDEDSGNNGKVLYSITAGDITSVFRIGSSSGDLYLAKQLDRETVPQYKLTIAVTDKGDTPRQTTATLLIKVVDFNDNKPAFTQAYYSFEIYENLPKDSFVGKVTANDSDIGRNGEVFYDMSNAQSVFSLNQMTGEIRLAKTVDRETIPNYILEIQASDYGEPKLSSTIRVFVNIQDVNDNCPEFTKQNYHAAITENNPIGTSVASVTANDKDSGKFGTVSYAISSGDSYGRFAISSTGEIRAMASLDREERAVYVLRIEGNDQRNGSCFSFAIVTVNVLDLNDNSPTFNSLPSVNVSENQKVGSIIHTVKASDKDNGLNASLTFNIIKPNPFDNVFSIDSYGNIFLKSRLDFETRIYYSFNMSVSDKGSPPRTTFSNLTIHVTDYNDNSPVLNRHPATVLLLENTTIGSSVMQFTAVDRDSGANSRISFSILSGNKNDSFAIDSTAGVLFINKELDYEHLNTYHLEIETKDHGVPQKRGLTKLTVVLKDVNDCPPKFNALTHNASVTENSSPGVLTQLIASDRDSGTNAAITYSITSVHSAMFNINSSSGVISTIRPLDREISPMITLTVVARDGGTPALIGKTTLTVNVLDINDNYPKISPTYSTVHIKENLPANLQVQKLRISDADFGINSSLSFLPLNGFGRFQLKQSGNYLIISTTTNLDREITQSYNLSVVVHDNGTPKLSAAAHVHVVVLDDNDFPPVFSQKTFNVKIQKGSPIQSFVTKLAVSDKDIGDNAKFQFRITSGDASYFDIEQQTGVITNKVVIPQLITLKIQAQVSDPIKTNFKDTATVAITTSTGYPKFSHSNQYASVSESLPVDSSVMKMNASSDELGPAGKISYFIFSGNVGRVFKIDKSTGLIAIGKALDYETRAIYSLWIEARDSSNPPLSSYVKIVITIINELDSTPRISSPTSTVFFTEQQGINALVTCITAIDLDNPQSSSRIRYKFANDMSKYPFSINEISGEVRSTKTLDRENKGFYNLTVIAYPNDQPLLMTSYTLDITVKDINDNSPVVHSPSTISIAEDMSVGSQVIVINATDADIGVNSKISFRLISSVFSIDSETGRITLRTKLDREVKASYSLSISVNDITFETIHHLTVLVTDINDSPPYFSSAVLRINVSENAAVGQRFGQVTANDNDFSLFAVSFYHFEPRAGYGRFTIDVNTGALALKKAVAFVKPSTANETSQNEFKLTVFARNVYRPFYLTNASLVISVTDYNDHAPVFTKTTYSVEVLTNASVGSSVVKLLAVDAKDYGLNAQVTFSIISGNGSTLFLIDGADVQIRASLSTFGSKVLQLMVQARDSGTPTRSSQRNAVVTILIVEPNLFRPSFGTALIVEKIPENYALYQKITKVHASDRDTGRNGEIAYSIKSGNTDNKFIIGSYNGSIFAVRPLDYELFQSYELSIQAKDLAAVNPLFDSIIVRVELRDVNDNKPLFESAIYYESIAENKPVKSTVLKVSATDKDKVASNGISYNIVDEASKSFFSIDAATGLIQTKVVLDYEQHTFFKITVSATDNGSPQLSSTATVNVNVVSKDEFPPKFNKNLYNFTVNKNAVLGSVVGNVLAVDKDKGIHGVPMYLPVTLPSPFVIDSSSGVIRVGKTLAIGKYTLKLFVKNVQCVVLTPDKIDEATVGIEVIEGNDAPWFTMPLYKAETKENAGIGNSVLTVTAVDRDTKPGGTVRYEIIKQQKMHFAIDAVSGVITVAAKLDREITSIYNLTVQATDNGVYPASNVTQVIIKILDVNDMAPEITGCNGSVFENATINSVVAKAFVRDRDVDPNRGPFHFRVQSNNEFGIKSNTGDLFVKSLLDREIKAVHNLTIYVTDNGSPSLSSRGFCVIKVLDVSDVDPKPRSVRLIVNNLGDFSPGGFMGDISPIDPDVSDVYTCQLNKSARLFTFEASSCKLSAASHRSNQSMLVTYSARTSSVSVPNNHALVDFINLKNATADKMLLFRLNGIKTTIQKFTNDTLDALSKLFISVSPAGLKILVIGYSKPSADNLDILLAMQDGSMFVMPSRSELERTVNAHMKRIKDITNVFSMTVPYHACSAVNACLNGATCVSLLTLGNSAILHTSEGIIFHSASFSPKFSCRCKPGFHGVRCEHAISKCSPNPCLNNGVCKEVNSRRSCTCTSGFTGLYCETDVNECVQLPCKNRGVCVNEIGGYTCKCPAMFTGKNCEAAFNYCQPNPCLHQAKCTRIGDSFACSCNFGFKGKLCEIQPMTFQSLSYLNMAYSSNQELNVTLEFTTFDEYSLLFYGFHKTRIGLNSPFVALELVNGLLRFSFSFGVAVKRKTVGSVQASDGNWHTAKVRLSNKILVLSLDKVEEYLTINEATRSPELGGSPLFIGGVDSIDAISERPKQVASDDFIGCMRNIFVNGDLGDQRTALKSVGVSTGCKKSKSCTGSPCKNGECINDWNGFQCNCKSGFSGSTCSAESKPFTFGGNSFVMFKLKDSYRRKLQLAEAVSATRKRRSLVSKLPDSNSFDVQLRTRNQDGILMYARDIAGNFTVLHIKDGQVHYRFDVIGKGSGSMTVGKPLVSDGLWHSISLRVGPASVSLIVDSFQTTQNSFSVSPHKFYSTYTDVLTIAGSENPLVINKLQLKAFEGCLNNTSLNGENLSLEQSNKFNITRVGSTTSSCPGRDVCASSPCIDPVLSYCVDNWEAFSCVRPGKCAEMPCKNNGVCVPIALGSYNCKCRANFTGTNCNIPLVCLNSPCKSNENCIADTTSIFRCVLIAEAGRTGLGTSYIVLIIVLIVIAIAFVVLLLVLIRRRKQNKSMKKLGKDFIDTGASFEMKETPSCDILPQEFDNKAYESEESLDVAQTQFNYTTDDSEFDNPAYLRDSWKSGLDLISKRNTEYISKSQPVFNRPLPHREATRQKGSNRSLPLELFVKEQQRAHSNNKLNDEKYLERERNERILQGLQSEQSDYDAEGDNYSDDKDSYDPRENNANALKLAANKFPSMPKIQLGAATPPFESGFESTGSDVDSEREPASITDVGLENASSQLELYDLEVASIGFSEMSWQNDNQSLREYRRENIDRFKHFAPHLDFNEHGSSFSDRNTRSDLDRLSDVMERDSSTDSDGSFTCSEYEYGDERIASNKLRRKRLVFSTHPKQSEALDSDLDSSFRPRQNSHCSSMTSITDVGSIDRGGSANRNVSLIPPINWDELLNWGMKYENLADVYRTLASLDVVSKAPRPTPQHDTGERGHRLQSGSERGSSAHSSQEVYRKPTVLFSTEDTHEEEYV